MFFKEESLESVSYVSKVIYIVTMNFLMNLFWVCFGISSQSRPIGNAGPHLVIWEIDMYCVSFESADSYSLFY